MSAGSPIDSVYEASTGAFFPIRVQPETLTLTLGGTANSAPASAAGAGLPSATVSRGRRSNGVNARLVRVAFTGTLPDGYKMGGTLTFPVLQPSVFNGYGRGQTGTYTLGGVAYQIKFVGKTAETIR